MSVEVKKKGKRLLMNHTSFSRITGAWNVPEVGVVLKYEVLNQTLFQIAAARDSQASVPFGNQLLADVKRGTNDRSRGTQK